MKITGMATFLAGFALFLAGCSSHHSSAPMASHQRTMSPVAQSVEEAHFKSRGVPTENERPK